jgi:ZIP family zinc transporter
VCVEGLIMFVSNESSSQLGLTVAAAMTIHNFIEGFLIALPLYYATGSRFASFAYASFLGGMSQPLGAVLGSLAIRNVDKQKEQIVFGIIFGVVSGMMCLIAVQVKKKKKVGKREKGKKNRVYLYIYMQT